MGIDEVLEVASVNLGKNVLIIRDDGSELEGMLEAIEDFAALLRTENQQKVWVPLGDVNWISRH